MTQTGFIAAMAADLAFAAYDAPAAVDRRTAEWVIVSVWGTNCEFLTLSRTGVAVCSEKAPPGLQPFGTHLGLLLSRVVTGAEEASEYLLMRNQPADIPVGGVFFPTDGFVRLTLRDSISNLTVSGLAGSSLTGHGRFAHCDGTRHGQRVVHDVPDPPPGAEDARAWHMTAIRRPWIGEFVPPERVLARPAGAPRVATPPFRRPPPVLAVPSRAGDAAPRAARSAATSSPDHLASDHLASDHLASDHLAPAGPAPHTRRRKRPEAKHGVTTEA